MKAIEILSSLHVIEAYINSDPDCNIAVKLVGIQFDLEEIAPRIRKQTGLIFKALTDIAGESNVDQSGNVSTYSALLPELRAEIDRLHETLNGVLFEDHAYEMIISEDSITLGKSVSAYRDMRRLCKKS